VLVYKTFDYVVKQAKRMESQSRGGIMENSVQEAKPINLGRRAKSLSGVSPSTERRWSLK
jgi:hypothetical protein